MSKVENKSQVVKKEVVKFSLADPETFKNCDRLTDPTYKIFEKLVFLIGLGRIGHSFNFPVKKTNSMSFQQIADFSVGEITKNDIDVVRNAVSELVSKGYLFRDSEGALAFTPIGSMQ